jgi:hypothetical protein
MYHVRSTVRLLQSGEGDIRSDDRHEQIHGTQNSIPLGKREEEKNKRKWNRNQDIESKKETNKKKQQFPQSHTKHQRNATFNKTTNKNATKSIPIKTS